MSTGIQKAFAIRGGATGGDPDQFYVERDADNRIFELLDEGKHCYLFAPKQSGKSSLAVHLQRRFREQGTCCVYIDLSVAFTIDDEQDIDDERVKKQALPQIVWVK
uniref:AAA-like domain n=1 Tax=Candidatus Kentrum sp. LFY TaxID=2126342 RepID=A0A450X5N8_9GAMM|nr:MAG: AAA-like domain [Candidatus Kentron sp. LFY]